MEPLALYIHVPFCQHKCIYCDFYSTTRTGLLPRFITALQQEIAHYQHHPVFAQRTLSSIYWGGGTPSLIPPAQLDLLLKHICSAWPVQIDAEITLEANPGALDTSHLPEYRRAGINRLSLGIQSFLDHELALLTRIHSASEAAAAVGAARTAGFINLGIDLIFGLPGQSPKDYEFSLRQALASKPTHLSLYGLTIEAGTPLYDAVQQGCLRPCTEEVEREMFLLGKALAEEAGYQHYEISNYALPGHETRHNQHYWTGSDYLGLGPSAHSFAGGERWWNLRNLDGYLAAWEKKQTAVAGRERLGLAERKIEAVMLGLRRNEGIDLAGWREEFGGSFLELCARAIQKLGGLAEETSPFQRASGEQLLTLKSGHLALTQAGVLLYDLVCRELCAVVN
jgi:oxygen-independent coproporphyrinogen-3 oxidase